MVYVYWPGRAIPDWLATVSGAEPKAVKHGGFGAVARRKGLHVLTLTGSMILVTGHVKRVEITTPESLSTGVLWWLRRIFA